MYAYKTNRIQIYLCIFYFQPTLNVVYLSIISVCEIIQKKKKVILINDTIII